MQGPMGGPQRMMAAEVSKPKEVGSTLRRLFALFRPYSALLLLVLALMIGATYVQVLSPRLIGQSVDCYLTPGAVSHLGVPSGQASQAAATNCWFGPLPSTAVAADYIRGLG
ncbi:MAG TPA: ABC transporter ATP-binding protein, partial [Anaerolineae bacterium]